MSKDLNWSTEASKPFIIDYTILYDYALKKNISYNELCEIINNSVTHREVIPLKDNLFKTEFKVVKEGIEIGYDISGGVDIRLGGEFIYVHINYNYTYTNNCARSILANNIVELLTTGKVESKSPVVN